MEIAKITNKGDRLEMGFRRAFHLRISLNFMTNWTDFGLPCLDQSRIPFPSNLFARSLPFPKIANNGSREPNLAAKCMQDIHNNTLPSNSVFHSKCLPTLCSQMEIGRYYQPFEKSSSADAMVRCGENDLLCFQFKNLQEPFNASQFPSEMKKCIVQGWNVIVVLVCVSGFKTENHVVPTVDTFVTKVEGVKGILLSIDSIKNFLGSNIVSKFSSTSMFDDAIQRTEHVNLFVNSKKTPNSSENQETKQNEEK